MKRGAQASLHVYDGTVTGGRGAVAESADDVAAVIAELEEEMQEAASRLEFERAALAARPDQFIEERGLSKSRSYREIEGVSKTGEKRATGVSAKMSS